MADAAHTWVAQTLARLAEAGFRNSAGRRAVIEALGAEHCAVSARDLEERMRAGGRDVGRATIYRSLEQLAELHLVTRVDVGDGTARYEPRHAGGEHHHHLICDTCGEVKPFEDEGLERAVRRLSEQVDFRVDEHDIVLHGACERCR
jgi:Fur family transcriptional regulator, ferric uptake regulator